MKPTAHILTELQSLGLRIQSDFPGREGGAGPAEGGAIVIGGFPVMVPATSGFVADSPFELRVPDGRPTLFENNTPLCPVETIPRPTFYERTTIDGVPYSGIALLHGRDCLATTIIQTCRHWSSGQRCRFCGIELSLKARRTIPKKSPAQLAEVAAAAKEKDGVTHVVLTTGDAHAPGGEVRELARCAAAVKSAADLPIQAQFSPPPDPGLMEELKDAGVDAVGIHIESFDLAVWSFMAPAKAALGLKRYEEAWTRAVEIFGPNQVSSFILAGIGEAPDSLIEGSQRLADLGVYPFIVPLRPIPGSLLEEARPPDPDLMKRVYTAVAQILLKAGLHSDQCSAGCVRCGACSTIGAYEEPTAEIVCYPARTREELEFAYAVRHEVFVTEQQLFSESDIDENDARSIHLIARCGNRPAGTVRIFPQDENGHWVGGRLAVKKDFRATGVGERLVKEAVCRVKKQKCSRFTAHIQEKNVFFFKKLGWKTAGPVETYVGRPHQLMEADLESNDDRSYYENADVYQLKPGGHY